MTATELEAYIHSHIPLSRAMGLRVGTADPNRIELFAPLAPNVNHRGSVFGGSLSAIAMLAGWGMCRFHADGMDPMPNLVIASSEMEFSKVATGDFAAICEPEPGAMEDFLDRLERKGRARIDLVTVMRVDSDEVARMKGVYAAINRSRS